LLAAAAGPLCEQPPKLSAVEQTAARCASDTNPLTRLHPPLIIGLDIGPRPSPRQIVRHCPAGARAQQWSVELLSKLNLLVHVGSREATHTDPNGSRAKLCSLARGFTLLRMRFVIVSVTLALGVAACAKEPFSGTATLSWTPVKTDTSGKALKNIAGYKIHYGTSSKAMNTVVVLNDPKQTTYVVKDLHAGTWYFAVSAYTTSGAEGALSEVASKRIK
jgi:hypothetical protein